MKKIIILTSCILLQIFIACKKSEENKEQLSSLEKVNTLGRFSIKTEGNKIIFAPKHKNIDAPLLYRDDYSNFNFNGFYEIETDNHKTGYFRFGWINFKDSTTVMSRVNWFYDDPLLIDNFEEVTINTLHKPLNQKGNIKICTIGDSQTWWSSASLLRQEIKALDSNYYFSGSNTDIYGYPHEGEGGNSTQDVLQRIDKIPQADFYTLLIGTNDWKKDISKAEKNILEITNTILSKYPSSKVIYLTPLPTTNIKRDEFNQKLAKRIENSITKNPKFLKLSIGEKMRKNKDGFQSYLSKDGLHPNKKGVEFMAKEIVFFINQYMG